jgi:hypothetical protein
MSQMLSNPPLELMQQLASAMSVQQMTTPQLQIIPAAQSPASTDCTTVPSSVASTGNKVCYPVDDITRPVTCTLVIRYDNNNNRTKKVGTCIAIPGHKFHGSDIPDYYCRVEVTVVVQGSEDDMLDIPGPEGIETLGQAIKNFILWPRRVSNWLIHQCHRRLIPNHLRLLKLYLYIHHHLHNLPMLLLILFLIHRRCHKHQHLGHHHLLHSHQWIQDNQRNLNSLYQNWCLHSRKRRVKLLLLARLDF